MTSSGGSRGVRGLTGRGQVTRARILRHAAELIYAQGVHATNNEQLRRVAGVSGSQLNHYFPTKESLVLAVIAWQAERVLTFHRSERFAGFDSLEAFRAWAEFYVGYEHSYQEGCSLGSLASEIIKTDLDVHEQLASSFDEWGSIFRGGIERMRQLGRVSEEADPVQLANLFLAAFQGGMLLAQVVRGVAPLKDALGAAIDYLETFVVSPDRAAFQPR